MHPSSSYQKHLCAILLFVGSLTALIAIRNKYSSGLEGSFNNETFLQETKVFSASSNRVKVKSYQNSFNMPLLQKKSGNSSKFDVYILGLFELSTKWGVRREGYSEMLAARLAVEHVNEVNILPGYMLKLITNDTQCDPGVGVDRFFHALYSSKLVLMLLGAGCSNVTESLANIVPYWNILQVSFGSTSPVLSNRNKFPLFFRTVAPDSSHNRARISFIKHFGWNTVATLSLSQQPFLLSLTNFVNELELANISCIATITFSLDNYKEQLKNLKDINTRIIFGSFSHQIAGKIFCEVYNLQMFGKDYVWILRDHNVNWWQNKECSARFLKKSVEGLILVSDYNLLSSNQTAVSGLQTNEEFRAQLESLNVSNSKYAAQSYDAIWTMALTMRNAIKCRHAGLLNQFSYKNSLLVKKFVEEMNLMNFIGVSGPVKFKGADRIGNSAFKQIQGGHLQTIAIYHAESNFLDFHCKDCKRIKFHGDQIPIAQRILKIRTVVVPKAAFIVILSFSLLGILVSLAFLYFNLHFRRITTVKLSSPRLNNVIVLGCVLAYVAVILLGLEQTTFLHLCTIRIYLLCAGFSLTFGSIFAKTYRVHRIFTFSGTSLLKDKSLKDKQLIALVFILFLIDTLLVIFWILIDPMEVKLQNLPIEISEENRGILYQPQVEVCYSQYTAGWFIAVYSYKGCLLIVGLYMAWETRHVKIPSLNDSQYIGICVYSVATSAVVVILSNFLSDYKTLSYLITALSILLSTSITLVQLFMPKFRSVFGQTCENDTIIQSMGLKLESNTRRLVFDDHHELLYRLEVQNRVYRNELDALDKEIVRLEDLLTKSSSSSITMRTPCSDSYIPTISTTRASWPSSSTCFGNPPEFHSDCKLHRKHSHERNTEKTKLFSTFRKFIGSFSSVSLSPSRNVRNNVIKEEFTDNLNLTPEFISPNCLSVNDVNVVRDNSLITDFD